MKLWKCFIETNAMKILTLSTCLPLLSQCLMADETKISFSREILPILSENCFYCHGPDKENQKADLRLDIREAAIEAFAWDTENPSKSEALIRIFSKDKDEVMPPPESHRSLSDKQKALVKKWIEQGAEYQAHWAFTTPPTEIAIPAISNKAWPKNTIDAFILARLEKEKITPSPESARERWLRRVSFDLSGLPPKQAEIDTFLADSSPKAKEAVVDRLLASPRFGERMATPWLDIARYADSFGYQSDIDMMAWPYRDWVIKSFNENLPLDQFIIQQLAGDLLPDSTQDQKIATAFNRIHRKTNEGGSVPEEFRQDGISDRVHTVGTAFMALTMECCRCHDHKYDPLSAKDYYSMGAFFNSIDEYGIMSYGTGIQPQPTMLLSNAQQNAQLATLQNGITAAVSAYGAHITAAEANFQAWLNAPNKTFPNVDLISSHSFDDKAAAGNEIRQANTGNAVFATGDNGIPIPADILITSDQPFSISLNLNPGEEYPEAVVFANSRSTDVPYSGYELLLEKGKLRWTLAREFPGNAISIATTTPIPTGQWTQVTVTNDGSRKAAGLKIYLNGKLAETAVVADTLTNNFVQTGTITFTARSRFPGLRGGMIDEIHLHKREITPAEVTSLFTMKPIAELNAPLEQLRQYYFSAIDPIARDLATKVFEARTAYRNFQGSISEIVVMRESQKPVPAYILTRGDYTMPAEKVERETPDWLPPFPEDQPRNRLGFAKWLTSPNHPLTARVMINRIWQEIFGKGIVASSDNFGLQGDQPTHPELLDWLARDFIKSGWDQKRAIKQMVLSATYAQDSKVRPELKERDPSNTLLARGPLRRLSAEQVRDASLALSGLLVEQVGGPSVKPYQAEGSMWKELNNFLPAYPMDKGAGLYRRSLYTHIRRTTNAPNMILFDSSPRELCSTRRSVTNTPLQALVTLNDTQYVEAARKLGERIMKEGGATDATRASWAYREVTGKAPSSQQIPILLDLIQSQRSIFTSKSSNAENLLKIGESPADPALDKNELAAFTTLAQALLNLDTHITLR
jgi:hypothetical protein